MKFRGLAFVGILSAFTLPQSVEAEDKKSNSSTPARAAPAPVVRAAPAPAPVVRAPSPVARAAPTPAPVIRAPTTTTAARPASTSVKPVATHAVKPAITTSVKPVTATVKPSTTTTIKPATATTTKPATTAAVKPAATTTVKPATTTATTTAPIDRARNRIQSELPADGAVRGDTQKKPDVNGVQASDFRPKVPYRKPVEVPGPGKPNFPKRAPNDPAPTNPLGR